jgi:hypothetical protein
MKCMNWAVISRATVTICHYVNNIIIITDTIWVCVGGAEVSCFILPNNV